MSVQKISTFLWFNSNAEEAVAFYATIFKKVKTKKITRWGDTGPGPKGAVLTIAFEIDGVQFTAMNGGPAFTFTEAISLVVSCSTQQEVDHYWEKLSKGGRKSQCGWLKDKFGLSWQVVPTMLIDLIADKDQQKANKAMQAMMKMTKINISKLEKAVG